MKKNFASILSIDKFLIPETCQLQASSLTVWVALPICSKDSLIKRRQQISTLFLKCRKIFAKLEISKFYIKLTGHKKLAMKIIQEDGKIESESDVEPTEDALFINNESLLKQPLEETSLDFN